MSNIGKPEYVTQERVIKLFVDELGYRYLGDWTDRDGNSNVEDRNTVGLAGRAWVYAGADQRGSLQAAH